VDLLKAEIEEMKPMMATLKQERDSLTEQLKGVKRKLKNAEAIVVLEKDLVFHKAVWKDPLFQEVLKDKEGLWAWKLYESWPIVGEPTEMTIFDGSKRKTWPLPWSQICDVLKGLGLEEAVIHSIYNGTVGNPELPHITAASVMWPSIQNLVRNMWQDANSTAWVPAEHSQEGDPYHACFRLNTLLAKTAGIPKLIKKMGSRFIEDLWDVYVAWPNDPKDVQTVVRMNRKTRKDVEKRTWPLPWKHDGAGISIVSLLTNEGWSAADITALKTAMLDKKAECDVHPNCTEHEVCWPDLQQVFRHAISEGTNWALNHELCAEYPPLAPKITLRLRIKQEEVKVLLEGEYRMFCQAAGEEGFSYGLIISDVDMHAQSFQGRPRQAGKYVIENGRMEYHPRTEHVIIRYDEVWPDGTRDCLQARVKSNAKFQCESADGFDQKATNMTINLPDDPEDRIGEKVREGVKKYFAYDEEAAYA